MAEDAPETVPVEAAAEQENAVEELVVNGDAPAATDGDLDNGNKRAREEGTEEQPEDEERAAKRAFAGAEENGAADHDTSVAPVEAQDPPADAPQQMENPAPVEAAPAAAGAAPPSTPALSDVVHPITPVADGKVSQVLEVAKHLVGKLIGKSGATIRQLQETSGCSIQVDQTNVVGDYKRVTLTAPSEEVINTCRDAIRTTLESDPPGPSEGEVQEVVKCQPGLVGRIIGRGGETIKMLQTASAAHIMINQNFPEGVDREITCKGPADAVERAVKMINELMAGEPNSAQAVIQKYGLGATLTLTCAQNLVGRVIGKGGETIKGLQRRFNVSVQIDQAQNPPVITISGPKQAATACQAEVRAIMADVGGPFGGGAPGGGLGFGFGGPRPGFAPAFGGMPYGGAPAPFPAPYGYGAAPAFPGYGAAPAAFAGYGAYGAGMGAAAGGYGAAGYGAAAGGYGAAAGGAYGAPAAGGYGGGAGGGADPYAQQSGGYGGGGGGAGGYGGAAAGGGGYGGAVGGGAPAQPAAASIWSAMQDDQGRTYYYNTQTGASQWEKPADMP